MLRSTTTIVIAIAVMMVAFNTAFAATEATELVQIILDAGSLDITNTSGDFVFNNVNLQDVVTAPGGWTEIAHAVPQFRLTDARGNGNGWHVNFKCTQLVNVGFPTFVLDLGYVKSGTTITDYAGQPIAAVPNGPYLENVNATDMHTDTLTVNTAQGYGKGIYNLNLAASDFKIPVPAIQAHYGTYTGLFTATILDGPGGTGGWTGNVN